MYSIFDVVKFMLLDFLENYSAFFIVMIIVFNILGFCFFNKR